MALLAPLPSSWPMGENGRTCNPRGRGRGGVGKGGGGSVTVIAAGFATDCVRMAFSVACIMDVRVSGESSSLVFQFSESVVTSSVLVSIHSV